MTIEIAQDWYDNNIPGAEGYILDDENAVYRKIITEDDLSLEFSSDKDGEPKYSNSIKLTSNCCFILSVA